MKALIDRPHLDAHILPYWEGFFALHGTRTWVVTAGASLPMPVSYTEIASYGQLHGFSGEDLADLALYVRRCDQHFLTWHGEKTERELKRGRSKSRNRRT